MVAEIERLGALHVRVAGQGPILVAFGALEQRAHQRGEQIAIGAASPLSHEQRQVGGDLIVARARRVQLAADGAGELGQAALDRHVDVLVLLGEGEIAGLELGRDPIEARVDLLELLVREDPERAERAGVGPRLRDILRPQAPVIADRGVEAPEERILGFTEARHGGQSRDGPEPIRALRRRGRPLPRTSR